MRRDTYPSEPTGAEKWLPNLLAWTGVVLLIGTIILAQPSLSPYLTSRLHALPPLQSLGTPLALIPPDSESAPDTQATAEETLLPSFVRPVSSGTNQVETALDTPSPASPTPQIDAPSPPDRPPTRILIPVIDVDAVVMPTGWQMTDIGGSQQPVWSVPEAPIAGWHETSAPLGIPGNTVISGHNWPQDAVFRDLYQVQPGDRIVLQSGNTPFVYEIVEILLLPEEGQPLSVRQQNARYIQPTPDERLTLVTCHPYGSTANRLIVIAQPGEPTQPNAGEE